MKDTKNIKLIDLIQDDENQISMLQELICFRKVKGRDGSDIEEISLRDLLAISKADISTIIIERIKDSLISEYRDYLAENKTEDGHIYIMPDNSCLSKVLDKNKKDLDEKDFFSINDFRFLLKECNMSSILVDKIKVLIDEESLNHFLTLSEKTTEYPAGDYRRNNDNSNHNSSAVKVPIQDYKENYIFPIVKIAFEISSYRSGPMSDYLYNLEISFSKNGAATTNYSFGRDHGYHKTIQRCIRLVNEKYNKIANDICTGLLETLKGLENLDQETNKY